MQGIGKARTGKESDTRDEKNAAQIGKKEIWQSTYLDRAAKRQNRGRMLFGLGGKEG